MTGFVQALGVWVREIVAVLFLAAVLEMVLPENDLKRFARVAVGFFVVLAVGRPILAVFGGTFYIDPTLSQLGLGSWRQPAAVGVSDHDRGSALERGQELGESAEARAVEATRLALADKIVELARREPGVREARAVVVLDMDPTSPAYGSLRSIHLTVWVEPGAAEDPEGRTDADPTQALAGDGVTMVTIEPIQVTVEPVITSGGTRADESAVGDTGSGRQEGSGLPGALAEKVASRLRSVLVLLVGVPPEGLTIEVRAGA